jgi:hypothetical protein
MDRLRVMLMLITSVALSGCNPPTPILQAELDANRAKWRAAGIDLYEYHYQRECFCPPAYGVVRVEDGKVVSVRPDFELPDFPLVVTDYPTIEDLFDEVQLNIGDYEVDYDPVLGYPSRISMLLTFITTEAGYTERASDLSPL